MGLAAHIAKRFSRPGGTEEDLRQVAMLGLVKAIDRFDPDYGVRFAAFAGSTIEGELKRHFRDHSWAVRVPRSAKELHLLVRRGHRRAGPEVGPVTVRRRDRRASRRRARRRAARARCVVGVSRRDDSLGRRNDGDGETPLDRIDALASEESGLRAGDGCRHRRRSARPAPEREREIVRLRFYEQLSQEQIAAAVGVSQMQVSTAAARLVREDAAMDGADTDE